MLNINYFEIFWLFMLGNIAGVLIEGIWCKFRRGKWETHSVTIWGAFNIVYGIGLPVFYIGSMLLSRFSHFVRFIIMSLLGSIVEYICGIVIRIGLGMRAWDYRKHFMNIQGIISLKTAIIWGLLGVGFSIFAFEPLKNLLSHMTGFWWNLIGVILTIFMAINILMTAVCVIRWANRHKELAAANKLTKWLDIRYPDSKMEKKYFYWHFIDEKENVFSKQ